MTEGNIFSSCHLSNASMSKTDGQSDSHEIPQSDGNITTATSHEADGENGKNTEMLLGGEQTRYTEYTFGKLQTQTLTVTGEVIMAGIATGSPIDGGKIKIPNNVSNVIIQSLYPYTALTIQMPQNPIWGKTVTVVSNRDVVTLMFENATFGTEMPTTMIASIPLRFIYAGQWFNN